MPKYNIEMSEKEFGFVIDALLTEAIRWNRMSIDQSDPKKSWARCEIAQGFLLLHDRLKELHQEEKLNEL